MRLLLATLMMTVMMIPATWAAKAQDAAVVPEDVAWVMQLNLPTLAQSAFGKAMIQEMENLRPGADRRQQAMIDALGLDPFKDAREVIFFGSSFERSDTSIAMDVGPEAGNIEGLLLAAPGYAAQPYKGDLRIHSIRTDDAARFDPAAARLFIAIVEHPTSRRWMVLASHREVNVHRMVDQVRDRNAVLSTKPLPEGTFMRTATLQRLPQLPDANRRDGRAMPPFAHVMTLIDQLEITGTADQRMTLNVKAKMIDDASARQMAQLVQGGIAMFQLAASNNPEAQRLLPLLKNIKVTQPEGGDTVQINMSMDIEELKALRPEVIEL